MGKLCFARDSFLFLQYFFDNTVFIVLVSTDATSTNPRQLCRVRGVLNLFQFADTCPEWQNMSRSWIGVVISLITSISSCFLPFLPFEFSFCYSDISATSLCFFCCCFLYPS